MDFSFLNHTVGSGESQTYLGWILSGMGYTALVSVAAYLLALAIGVAIGALRTRTGPLSWAATAVFEFFSSIPLKVQMFFFYFVLPALLAPKFAETASPLTLSLTAAIGALGFFMGCRVSGHIYSAIRALADSQAQAAKALGLSTWQTYSLILIPQAIKNSLPALVNELLSTVKNSSIAGTIGLAELFYQCKRLNEFTAAVYEPFVLVLFGYLIINITLLLIMRSTEKAKLA
ncbi:TPA: amino acid ABC transporter permease [Serratia marcescens]|uniref:Amino acid ABC transporter permease n=1 Tax=Serratia nevei TaxID=2703794 RepID=A0ABT7G5Q4_9GAMM|nr:amino acid ABC transporter permease [Serratia nevei]HAU4290914.1 amino acid ABC transporter permease [Serratia marcescens]MDK5169082.1 amino acid ABC transporter permease [Serratia nevei]MDK5298576.1 amino acid ABC transporter permease [Serratia nevei]MEC5887172.1 amino acid ABC transporter permease [Serratia nevei]HAU4299280.1 amino acid ABC transporter permease [Serratia marcescens]